MLINVVAAAVVECLIWNADVKLDITIVDYRWN
jgi:hypothetical protein